MENIVKMLSKHLTAFTYIGDVSYDSGKTFDQI